MKDYEQVDQIAEIEAFTDKLLQSYFKAVGSRVYASSSIAAVLGRKRPGFVSQHCMTSSVFKT